jgi:hypothetical protein
MCRQVNRNKSSVQFKTAVKLMYSGDIITAGFINVNRLHGKLCDFLDSSRAVIPWQICLTAHSAGYILSTGKAPHV